MKDYKQRILECMEELKAIKFPCEDWEELFSGWYDGYRKFP